MRVLDELLRDTDWYGVPWSRVFGGCEVCGLWDVEVDG